MWESGKDADTIVKEEGLVQITDTGAIEEIVNKLLLIIHNQWQTSKVVMVKAIGFLVGQVMKESKGRANPRYGKSIASKILERLICPLAYSP